MDVDKIQKLDDILLKRQNHPQIGEVPFFIKLNFITT